MSIESQLTSTSNNLEQFESYLKEKFSNIYRHFNEIGIITLTILQEPNINLLEIKNEIEGKSKMVQCLDDHMMKVDFSSKEYVLISTSNQLYETCLEFLESKQYKTVRSTYIINILQRITSGEIPSDFFTRNTINISPNNTVNGHIQYDVHRLPTDIGVILSALMHLNHRSQQTQENLDSTIIILGQSELDCIPSKQEQLNKLQSLNLELCSVCLMPITKGEGKCKQCLAKSIET